MSGKDKLVENESGKAGFSLGFVGWVGVVLTVLSLVFILQNRMTVTINFFWLDVSSPLWFVLLLIFLLGWFIGYIFFRRRLKEYKK